MTFKDVIMALENDLAALQVVSMYDEGFADGLKTAIQVLKFADRRTSENEQRDNG